MTSRSLALLAGFVIVCLLGGAGLWLNRQPDGARMAAPAASSVPPPVVAMRSPEVAGKPGPSVPAQPMPGSVPVVPAPERAASAPAGTDNPRPAPIAGASEPPTFDVVRVEPSGDAVLAGKGLPHSAVALMASGKVVAETKADDNGNFVLIPPPLKPGDHDLTLRQDSDGKPPVLSPQSVAVKVQKRGGGPAIVALAEPGKATQLLSDKPAAGTAGAPRPTSGAAKPPAALREASRPPASDEPEARKATTAPAAGAAALAFRSVELENGDGFYATGVAKAGTHVEIYLNDSRIAGVTAAPDGQWSVKVLKGLTAGRYSVRADAIGAGRRVTTRAEVSFDVPVAMAETGNRQAADGSPGAGPAAPGAPGPAAPGVPVAPTTTAPADLETTKVEAGRGAPATTQQPTPAPGMAKAPAPSGTGQAANTPLPPDASIRSAPTPVAPVANGVASGAGAAPVATASADTSVGADAGSAVVEAVETARVIGGDSLWRISRTRLGQGHRFTQIYAANAAQIRDPNRIFPDQVFVMPRR